MDSDGARMSQGGDGGGGEEGNPWIRRRTAPMRFAPLNKNKVTVSLPEAVAAKEDKLKLQRQVKTTRTTRSSTASCDLFSVDAKKVIYSPKKVCAPPPPSPTIDLTLSPSAPPPPAVVVATGSPPPPPAPEEEFEEFPIKVLQTPISMFEFKATTKFNVVNALSMGLTKRPLNVYGEPCAPVVLQEDLLEVEVVQEPQDKKGPEGSEYGQEERLAAKKLRLKRRRRFSKVNPKMDKVKEEISLKVQDEMAHYHKMKGNPRKMNDIQGTYYALIPDADGSGELHAYPVKDWCKFDHLNNTKHLTEEEAEETFRKRDKILNLFSVMVEKRLKEGLGASGEEDEEEDSVLKEAKAKKKRRMEDSQDSDVEMMENGDSGDSDY